MCYNCGICGRTSSPGAGMKKHVLYRTINNGGSFRKEVHREVPVCEGCEDWLKIAPFEEVMRTQGRSISFAPVPPPVVPKPTPRPIGRPAKVQDVLDLVGAKEGFSRDSFLANKKENRLKKHPARTDMSYLEEDLPPINPGQRYTGRQ